ncbi:MAG TPA: peptidoglycan DD-metalloendopeptidase family protein [Candidatus Limnocylindrales bacterium]
MTPVRLGLLAVSLVALIVAVYVVFVGVDRPNSVPPTLVAQATPGPGGSPAAGTSAPLSSALPSPTTTAGASPSAQPPLNPLAKSIPAHSVEPGQLTGYIWPVNHALITTRFAPEAATAGGFVMINGVSYHDGVDLATHCNDKVRAAHDGTVLYAGRDFDPYLGYRGDAAAIYARLQRLGRTNQQAIVVVIDDGNGYRSVYVHLSAANAEAGAVVKAGDVIGLEGETGFASGCHLHYTLFRMDGPWQPVVARLLPFGYPPLVRERINPLDVLPWGDPNAPQVLQNKVNPPSPTPEPSGEPTTSPSPSPSESPAATTTPAPTSH